MLKAVRAFLACLLVGLSLAVATPVAAQPAAEKSPPPITLVVFETIGVADGNGGGNPGIPSSAKQTTPASSTTTEVLPPIQVHFIDVGQGDAILIDYGTVEILIDGGPTSSALVPYLSRYVDGDLEAIVATHPHADHIGGLIDVLQAYQVDKIYWSGETYTTQTFADFMTLAATEPQSTLTQLRRGDAITVGGLTLAVLNPPDFLFADPNDNSLVLRLDYGDTSFLFAGDAAAMAENDMLSSGLNLDADILKVGHHGSRTSSSMPFLQAISSQTAIYSAGVGNSYGHPHSETIAALGQVGASIYGTDVNGTVVVSTDGMIYTVSMDGPSLSVTEVVTASDSRETLQPASLAIDETVLISDSSTSPQPLSLNVVETIRVSDASSVPLPATLTINETIRVSDSSAGPVLLTLTVNETILVADTNNLPLPLTLTVNETISVTDTFTRSLPVTLTVNETISVTDTFTRLLPLTLTVSETISVTDTFTRLLPLTLTINETVSVTDTFTRSLPVTLTIPEVVIISDIAGTSLSQVTHRLTVSVTGRGDTLPGAGSYDVTAGQTVTITALPAGGWDFHHWSGDAGGGLATVTFVMTGNKSVTANFIPQGSVPIDTLRQYSTFYEGKIVTLWGFYRGWESGHGVQPVTRSDWVLQDTTGDIYITGGTLDLRQPEDIGREITVTGTVRRKDGVLYIELPRRRY